MLSVAVGIALAMASVPSVHEPTASQFADEQTAIRLTNDAARYWTEVKPDQALSSARRAKALWEELGETNRHEYIVAVNNVITAQLLRGDLRDTAPLIEEARALYARTLPDTDKMLPLSLMVLGTAYKATGNHKEALTVLNEALSSAEKQHAPGSVVSKIETSIGDLLELEARPAEAASMLRKAVSFEMGNSEADLVSRAGAYRVLGTAERSLGDNGAAEADERQALKVLGNRHGHADVARAEVLVQLAILEEQSSHWKAAEHDLIEAVALMEKVFGPGHPNTAPVYSNLGSLYLQRHDYKKAGDLYRIVLATESRALPAEHPSRGRDLNNLATVAFKEKRFDEAEDLLRRALTMMDHTLGPTSEAGAQIEANLANTLSQRKEYGEAEKRYEHALATLDQSWGENDPRLMNILSSYADLCRMRGEPAEAEKLETRMERIRVKQAIQKETTTSR